LYKVSPHQSGVYGQRGPHLTSLLPLNFEFWGLTARQIAGKIEKKTTDISIDCLTFHLLFF
ncbi:hypothetical protein, partial [Bacillus thuringiensis]|uniref:hypothetical protein n=1 Tax=Bacillus thuringiensis TaxID=1428 RepID=UPI001C994A0F